MATCCSLLGSPLHWLSLCEIQPAFGSRLEIVLLRSTVHWLSQIGRRIYTALCKVTLSAILGLLGRTLPAFTARRLT
ncbi:hypothetical protein VTN31DRAFT_458 [Thermomyces dupontii]|uniref:uncharacterized protein n=1 Tax=Talaromyces thermophilus TaxID=28565 RepID=UPI0037425A7C